MEIKVGRKVYLVDGNTLMVAMRRETEEGNKANDWSDLPDYPISHISHPIILLFVHKLWLHL